MAVLAIFLLPGTSRDLNKEVTVNGRTFLYGEINRQGLTRGQYNTWFKSVYDRYQLNPQELKRIHESHLKGVSIKLLMGTWCGDSKRNVPAFFKFMDQLGLSDDQLQAWALDLRKTGPNKEEMKYQVRRVPTIIFYRNGVEIGRFIERPKPGQRLEQIWADILTRP